MLTWNFWHRTEVEIDIRVLEHVQRDDVFDNTFSGASSVHKMLSVLEIVGKICPRLFQVKATRSSCGNALALASGNV